MVDGVERAAHHAEAQPALRVALLHGGDMSVALAVIACRVLAVRIRVLLDGSWRLPRLG